MQNLNMLSRYCYRIVKDMILLSMTESIYAVKDTTNSGKKEEYDLKKREIFSKLTLNYKCKTANYWLFFCTFAF